jgi:hypothetical protein
MKSSHGVLVAAALITASGTSAGAESPALHKTADAVRGGWVADVNGVRHIFILKVRGTEVSGIYCPVDCSDPANLAFIERGELTADGVKFQILQSNGRSESRTDVVGRVADAQLQLTTKAGNRSAIPAQLNLLRDPRKPATTTVEAMFARRGVQSSSLTISGSSTPYTAPGPNETLTPTIIEGLWVWSDGPGRQHFMFRQVGKRVLGAVCGPCDNPYTFGPIDNIAINGDTLTFDIVHEDWGMGIEFGPFENHARATLARHQLHLQTTQQAGTRTIHGDLILTGPIRTTPR